MGNVTLFLTAFLAGDAAELGNVPLIVCDMLDCSVDFVVVAT